MFWYISGDQAIFLADDHGSTKLLRLLLMLPATNAVRGQQRSTHIYAQNRYRYSCRDLKKITFVREVLATYPDFAISSFPTIFWEWSPQNLTCSPDSFLVGGTCRLGMRTIQASFVICDSLAFTISTVIIRVTKKVDRGDGTFLKQLWSLLIHLGF